MTCRHGGDVVIHHNRLWDEIFDLCRRAHLSVSVERGHGLTRDLDHTRPADISGGFKGGGGGGMSRVYSPHPAKPMLLTSYAIDIL